MRIRLEMRRPNRSWRVEETYVKVEGKWAYLYRAVDSAGETIEFRLSPNRDLITAQPIKHFRGIVARIISPSVTHLKPSESRASAELSNGTTHRE